MDILFITFGQEHVHNINGVVFDKDCVGVIHCNNYSHGREIAFENFGDKFATTYSEDKVDNDFMRRFDRGIIEVN